MSASAFPKPSLRPYLAADLPLLAEIRFAAPRRRVIVANYQTQRDGIL